jgi:hypothetical protein
VILWEALTGERMWKSSSEGEIRARVLAGDLPMSETARPDVPETLARICRRALSRAPGERHATARQLADELDAAMSALGLAASHREIGAMVARLFEDVRTETKRTIETKLGRASMATGLPAVSDTGETRVLRAMNGNRPRWRRIAGVTATVAVVMFGLLTWRLLHSIGEERPESAVPAAAVAAPIPTPATKAQTNLTAATSPDATASANEPTAPAPATKPARATGARATLKRSQPASAAPAAAPAPTTGGPPAPADDCDHPFFVDSNGIKRFRPECM